MRDWLQGVLPFLSSEVRLDMSKGDVHYRGPAWGVLALLAFRLLVVILAALLCLAYWWTVAG